jgi:hypothetical protein
MIREARALANVLLDHHHDCDTGLLPRRFPSIVTLSPFAVATNSEIFPTPASQREAKGVVASARIG